MSAFQQSPWIIHYDASSCNGCDIETLACLTPLFDVERLGVVNTGNPKHADIFLVTGAVNEQCKSVIRTIYDQMPEPKVVVAVGACASSGGIFRECYNVSGGVDSVIPVDVYVPGCAARPEAIIDGVVAALGVLENKVRAAKASPGTTDQILISRAERTDAPEILALQRAAYQNEPAVPADLYLAFLQQTLADLENDVADVPFFKVVINGKIIGAARAAAGENRTEISRIMVHPYFRRRGIGNRILRDIEAEFETSAQLEALIPKLNQRDLSWFQRRGFLSGQAEPPPALANWTILAKERA